MVSLNLLRLVGTLVVVVVTENVMSTFHDTKDEVIHTHLNLLELGI